MRVDGAKSAPVQRVELDEFFDRPAHVDIKAMSPYGKAMIREIVMEGFEVGDLDAKGKTAEVKSNPKGMAEREMRARDTKLRYAFVSTDIMADGVPAAWDKALWDALDETDPRILEKVVDAINGLSKVEGDDEDPT